MREATPATFWFTNIQVSYNVHCRVHADANNLGPCYIMAMGVYTDGHLWIANMTAEKKGHRSPTGWPLL